MESIPDPAFPPGESPAEGPPRGRSAVGRGPDRRRESTPRLSRFAWFGGRRRSGRRAGEREGTFVDVYGAGILIVLLWVALTNVADSFFTMVHLQNGGTEANPVAALLLQTGRTGFVVIKSTLVALALLVLCLHKNFHVARVGIWTAVLAYTLLLAYHLALFVV